MNPTARRQPTACTHPSNVRSSHRRRQPRSWRRSVTVASVLSLLLLAGGLATWLGWRSPAPSIGAVSPQVVEPSSASAALGAPARAGTPVAATPAPATPRSGFAYEPGDHLRFKFSIERIMEVTFTPDPSQPVVFPGNEFVQRLAGTLSFKVYAAAEDAFEVGFELERVQGSLRTPQLGDVLPPADIAAGMAGEVLGRLARRGAIETLSFPQDTTVDGRNQWRDLLALWQVVLAEDPEQETWEVTEEDTTGRFQALYERTSTGAITEIVKEKLVYTAIRDRDGSDGGLAPNSAVDGGATIELDPLPLRIAGHEQLEIRPREFPQILASEVRYSFERLSGERQSPIVIAGRPDASSHGAPVPPGAAEYLERGPRYEPLSDEGIEGLLGESRQVIASFGVQSPQIAAHLGRLVEHMKNDPRVVDAVMRKLRARDADADESAVLFGALGAAGTPEAQDGLQEIFSGETFMREERLAALLSFSEVEQPVADVDALLVAMEEDGSTFAPTALLLLGAVGNRVRESDPPRFAEIQAHVERRMAESASREEHMTVLEALGNLGPGETPAAVEELFESEDAELRSSSVRALRDTFDARADALLASALREDPVDEVRLSAVELLVENGARGKREGAVSLLDESLRSDESEDVRKGALAGMNVLATEDAMRSVEWTAGNDGSEEIRAMATAILEQWQQTREQPEAGF